MPQENDQGGPFDWGFVPVIYITPDLGWASVDSMLDPTANPAAVQIEDAEVSATLLPFTGYLGPQYRVLDLLNGSVVEIDVAVMLRLIGHGMKHYYRRGTSGDVGTFVLRQGTIGL